MQIYHIRLSFEDATISVHICMSHKLLKRVGFVLNTGERVQGPEMSIDISVMDMDR